ncbi:MAG: DUF3391 domain-containing protein, partial [Gammaproteobacteria bacterium]|nr:DUF3391 domain-containing protein [Gammaproteobacteria bacterium]
MQRHDMLHQPIDAPRLRIHRTGIGQDRAFGWRAQQPGTCAAKTSTSSSLMRALHPSRGTVAVAMTAVATMTICGRLPSQSRVALPSAGTDGRGMTVDDFPQEFRINVRGLAVGMYVARLDRPWLGTRYPLQGFKVGSEEDIRELQRLCSHVYVDVSRGPSPHPHFVELEAPDLVRRARGHDEIAELHKTQWQLKTDLETELPHAEQAHDTLKQGIAEVMQDLEKGRDLHLDKLRNGVDAMIESITRNPAAFSWLKAIKRKDNYAYHHALG